MIALQTDNPNYAVELEVVGTVYQGEKTSPNLPHGELLFVYRIEFGERLSQQQITKVATALLHTPTDNDYASKVYFAVHTKKTPGRRGREFTIRRWRSLLPTVHLPLRVQMAGLQHPS